MKYLRWWKTEPNPEEQALAQAAMRVRMEANNLGSANVTRTDRAHAAIIAESLELSGYALVKVERPAFGYPTSISKG